MLDVLNAISTVVIAVFAVVTGIAVWRQITTDRDGVRAWIMVDIEWGGKPKQIVHESLNPLEGGAILQDTSISIVCICRNSGQSPAWITEKRIRFEIVEALPKAPKLELTRVFHDGLEPLAPGDISRRDEVLFSHGSIEPGKIGVIYGVIKYRDVFGCSRQTRFGYNIDLLNMITGTSFQRISDHPEYNNNT